MTNPTRTAQGRFAPGNTGNPKPHNVRSQEERQAEAAIRDAAKEYARHEGALNALIDARLPTLLVHALNRAESDDAVLAPTLQLLAERQRSLNLVAERALRAGATH